MSWATDKTAITGLMTGYTEIGNNLKPGEQPSSVNHKSFSLKPVEVDTSYLMADTTVSSNIAELQVHFIVKTNADYDTQYDAWTTLLSAIKSKHLGYASNPTFIRSEVNNKYAIGTALIYVGVTTCA